MIGLIMAGGYATRLWPITKAIAKPLLPIGKKRIIDLIVENLERLGLEKIYVTTNAFYRNQFEEWIKGSGKDIELIVEKTTREEEKLGTIRAMYEAFKKIGEEEYIVVGGDNVFSLDFREFVKFYDEKNAPTIAAYEVKELEEVKRFGEIIIDSNYKVVSLREKPEFPKSKLVSTACYIFPKDTLNLLEEYIRTSNKFDSPGFFIEWLYKRVDVYAYPFKGYWFDVGTPTSYIDAFKTIMNSQDIGDGVELIGENSLMGSLYIGDGTKIIDSIVEDSLVLGNTRIVNSKIKNSIILNNTEIENCQLENCIIANDVKIVGLNLRDSVVGEYTKLFVQKMKNLG